MVDRREQILARLVEIAEAMKPSGINTVVRNRELLADEEQPAIQILDSDESADEADPSGRPANSTRRVVMSPEIYVTLGDKPKDVGTRLNGYRVALIKAIETDAALKAIVGTNGGIRYVAGATALSRGRALQGELGISYAFTYPLIVSEL